MQPGIFAKTYAGRPLEEILDCVASDGLTCVQFNMSCAGLESMPREIPEVDIRRVRRAFQERGLTMSALSGTFNMIHPEPRVREDGLLRLRTLAENCRELGTGVITLCTGSRDPENMWRKHPGNSLPDAWSDLREAMNKAVEIAEESGVVLGVEPEVSNVIDSAAKARRLLDETGSEYLKVVMDGANLFHAGDLQRMETVLRDAFALLGPDIALAHAKDIGRDGEAGHLAAGTGLLDYGLYLRLLAESGYSGPLILHSLSPDQVPASVEFLRAELARLPAPV